MLYAIIQNGTVVALTSPADGTSIAQAPGLTPAQIAAAVAVPSGSIPGIGWTESAGAFTPPGGPPPPPTLAQQAATSLAAGITITSTSTPALDGTYAATVTAQQQITAEITSILLNDTFADGTTTIEWLDTSGAAHAFTVAQFKTLATAIAAFVSGCVKAMNGQATTLPAAAMTIP